ncbi:MAG: hypothetical protein M0P97_01990 [Candidatus Moranbacteria bacterium]|jgi:hypothetical protein|nr:hypothetical protein [Candidatus Moranbacteria bacterium]
MLTRLWDILTTWGNDEIDELRFAILAVVASTVIGALSIVIFRPTIENAYWFPVICWFFSAYRIFSIKRYVTIHLTGEGLEALRITSNQPGVLDNELAKLYWKIITNVFLAQTMIFLSLPVYINYTEGKASLLLPAMMIIVAISIANWKSATTVFRFIGTIIIIVFLAEFIFGFTPNIKSSLAKRATETELSVAKFINPSTGPQIISYIPSATPAEIPLGKGKWKFSIMADEKYIIPGMRVAVNTGKELPISPLGEGQNYYGGILVNMSPNNSVVNSDGRVVVTLKLPLGIQMVKGNAVMISFEPL